jgi:glycerophosphoryl diester phosphodiesterase
MAAFRVARELGAPGVELDVHICAAGELVVAHDDTFKRTAGDERAVEALTLQEIRAIDVGSFFDPSFKDERPPLLEEVLEEFCPGMYIDIELKSRKVNNDPLPEAVAKKIKVMGKKIKEAVTISSFNPFVLRTFKWLCPDIATAAIWKADTEVPAMLRHGFGRHIAHCDYVKPTHLQTGRFSRLRFALLERRPMVPWTVDDAETAERLLALGSAGLITNRPQDILPVIQKHVSLRNR